MKISLNQRYSLLVLPLLSVVLCMFVTVKIFGLLRDMYHNWQQLRYTTEDQRMGRTYTSLGYDYIKNIVSFLPNKSIFPVTRYSNITNHIEIIFPQNTHALDSRVLIGIGIFDADMQTNVIASANRLHTNAHTSVWSFQTIWDYDTMNSIQLLTDGVISLPIKISLYSDLLNHTLLGSWIFLPSTYEKDRYTFLLPQPIYNFSFNKGSADFIIELADVDNSTSVDDHVTGVIILGKKVDLHLYHIVQKNGNNFTALRNDFFEEIERNNIPEWKQFLSKLSYE